MSLLGQKMFIKVVIGLLSLLPLIRSEKCSLKDFPDLPPTDKDHTEETFDIVAVLSVKPTVGMCGTIISHGNLSIGISNANNIAVIYYDVEYECDHQKLMNWDDSPFDCSCRNLYQRGSWLLLVDVRRKIVEIHLGSSEKTRDKNAERVLLDWLKDLGIDKDSMIKKSQYFYCGKNNIVLDEYQPPVKPKPKDSILMAWYMWLVIPLAVLVILTCVHFTQISRVDPANIA